VSGFATNTRRGGRPAEADGSGRRPHNESPGVSSSISKIVLIRFAIGGSPYCAYFVSGAYYFETVNRRTVGGVNAQMCRCANPVSSRLEGSRQGDCFFGSDLERLSRNLLDDQHAIMADIEDSLYTASVTERRGLIKARNAVSELEANSTNYG